MAAQRIPYPAAASTATAAGGSGNRDPEQTRVIRQSAFDQSYEISERGRTPIIIEETYTAAH
ncbi:MULTISPECIES: Lsr2 family protein [unclassified Rhodococcus (in: high G+C Gram-positive bacteria)]|uniref:Lsr2 family protein n=1 Tax=unclassified Rhodococcus (in: high G+C Gram-positive bacteria) TaxID=192944 RepID=UPI001FF90A0E|nr:MULTISPECIES: Lsr2 family protein [unclassified Rhodococcus (in: high G+C Gram-positive bacteria)]